ncbi:MAG TPA: HIT family protein [Candidatus Thermoplasmatota archaeon]|nr:HIT family protein [Candidatus Thermoplasmatota archaeon]
MAASATCVFCRIVSGDIPATKVHEDAHVVAFLDVQPLRPGHVLVVPRSHVARLHDMPHAEADALWRAVHAIAPRAEKALGASATTIGVNNGRASGQEVPHVHVHIVPRKEGDGAGPFHAAFPDRPSVTREEMQAIAERMRSG